jgi:hypothetical protein
MGKPLPQGVNGDVYPPTGDIANSVVQGIFTGVGPGIAVNFYGAFNVLIWASLMDALTTTAGSAAATLASGTDVAPGASINSVLVPLGTTVATAAAGAITLSFPTIALEAKYVAGFAQITNLPSTAGLLGAAVIGPGWPISTTITGFTQQAQIGPNGQFQSGIATTSQTPTVSSPIVGIPLGGNGQNRILFQLGPNSVTAGTDTAALLTGPAIEYVAMVELERSFDGGATWITCNVGGSGQLAQYGNGTPVSFFAGDPERGVAYRLNCTAYTATANIILNYRMSTTGQAATSLSINTI